MRKRIMVAGDKTEREKSLGEGRRIHRNLGPLGMLRYVG